MPHTNEQLPAVIVVGDTEQLMPACIEAAAAVVAETVAVDGDVIAAGRSE